MFVCSDVGNGSFTVDYASDSILSGTKQTYLKVSVYGDVGDRRMKVQYLDLQGNPYFESMIHEDMLKSSEEDSWKLMSGLPWPLLPKRNETMGSQQGALRLALCGVDHRLVATTRIAGPESAFGESERRR